MSTHKHVTLNFYNSARWTRCAASAVPAPAVPGDPEPQSDAQREGIAAAWVADIVLRGDATTAEDAQGETAPNGWIITEDMVHHVQGYIDHVQSHGGTPRSETALRWNGVYGRPDAHVSDTGNVLHIDDLKYGYKIIEPEGNTQLLLAACALVQPHHTEFNLTIYQPRPYHPAGPCRIWTLTRRQLEEWSLWLADRVTAAEEPNPVATPGEQCDYCPRRTCCPAIIETTYATHDVISSRSPGRKLTGAELASELRFLQMAERLLKARLSGTASEAEARARAGEFIPGWALETNRGRRELTASPDVVADLTGVDPYKRVLKSPAELEREGVPPPLVKALSTPPYAGVKLTEWKPSDIKRMFDK